MTLPIALVLCLLAAAVAAFSIERIPVDVTTLLLLCVLVLSGTLTVEEAFSGFSNDIIIILAAIFVLSGALMKGGVVDHLGEAIHRVAGGSRTKVLLCVLPVTTFVSSFMNNTTTTAVLMPAVLGVCRRSRISPGKVLIPLAYASMLGGTCTPRSASGESRSASPASGEPGVTTTSERYSRMEYASSEAVPAVCGSSRCPRKVR